MQESLSRLQRDNRALEHEREELAQQVASLQLIKSGLEEQNTQLDGQVAELTASSKLFSQSWRPLSTRAK